MNKAYCLYRMLIFVLFILVGIPSIYAAQPQSRFDIRPPENKEESNKPIKKIEKIEKPTTSTKSKKESAAKPAKLKDSDQSTSKTAQTVNLGCFTSPTLKAKFVLIPAGRFMMGSPSGEPGRFNNEAQHQVTISKSFYMQTTEVTQGQWEAIMRDNPSHFTEDDELPVENVSWEDVQNFIKKLNQKEGTDKYRLPTEAEWEYAARAGTTDARYGELDEIAWYDENSEDQTHPVGEKEPNTWGLYDMLGNVWEWCSDWYGDYPRCPVTDPKGPSTGIHRVGRGGSWDADARGCRAVVRGSSTRDGRDGHLGFRLARTL